MAIIESPVAASESRRRQGWSLSGGAFDSPTPPLPPPTVESIEAARASQQAERAQFTALTGVDLTEDGAIVLPPCVVAQLERSER